MQIEILATTTDSPLSLIGTIAGTSYGKSDANYTRAVRCFEAGHMSVFEHVTVTWKIRGISRACSHQLVRHRLASYCQKSQRYTKLEDTRDWFVIPDSINGIQRDAYIGLMCLILNRYFACIEAGVSPEDARYVLPEATKTEICMTMNLREFLNFCELRTDKSAQWEIRELALNLLESLRGINEEYRIYADLVKNKVGIK